MYFTHKRMFILQHTYNLAYCQSVDLTDMCWIVIGGGKSLITNHINKLIKI